MGGGGGVRYSIPSNTSIRSLTSVLLYYCFVNGEVVGSRFGTLVLLATLAMIIIT